MSPRRFKTEDPEPPIRPQAISWFPPHMYRAQKRLAQEIKHVDLVLEVRDARLPQTSGNVELAALVAAKKRIILFNKTALADPAKTKIWQAYYRSAGIPVLFLDADSGKSLNLLYPLMNNLVAPAMDKLRMRGIRPPPQRIIVIGMPNVGKSTLINRMAHGKKLETAPTPGVTKSISWVRLKNKHLLMDTPGVMLPRLGDTHFAMQLGWIAAIRDTIIGEEKLAAALLSDSLLPPSSILTRYDVSPKDLPEHTLEAIAYRRGMLRRGGLADTKQAAAALLADFRAGRLGRITLEIPPQTG